MASSNAAKTVAGALGFPWKPALASLTVFAALFAWHRFKNPETGLYPSIFADAFKVHLRAAAKPAHNARKGTALTISAKPGSVPAAAEGRPPISAFLIDDSGALDPFFASLHELEAGKQAVVTVLHYGDSPTTADLITGDVRALLQARFGDAGHGFNLIAKPWAWYGHRDVAISDHGWKSITGVGSMRQAAYGLGGARFEGESGAKTTYKLADAAQTDVELQFFTEPEGGTVTITADGIQVETVDTKGDAGVPSAKLVHLPANTKEIGLAANGPVTLLGVDFKRGSHGVVYDSLGLNGASTTVLSRAFDPSLWAAELQHAAPALVVINYGTNESSFGAFVDKQYEGELRTAVARVRKALPTTPILIMSPMDRGERAGLNEIRTMDTIPRVIAIQQKVAADLHCAFFDTFDAMGGDGTMSDWYNGKPRLVAADLIHPTPQGALIVAQEMVDNLNLGYLRWEKMQGIAAQAPVAAQACRPVAKTDLANTEVAKGALAPPGTIGAPAEPLPATNSAPQAGSGHGRTLPPCPPKAAPAKAQTKPNEAKSNATAKAATSGDTKKNDRSNAGEATPVPPPHL